MMNKKRLKKYLACLLSVSLTYSLSAQAHEPANLSLLKNELVKYHDSNEYMTDINNVVKQALRYLNTRIHQTLKNGKKPAIVLDIDETSLSNYEALARLQFGGNDAEMWQAEKEGMDQVITPTLSLYRFAKAHHVAVFFITGRHEEERNATVANLEKVGFKTWDGLVMKPEAYYNKSAALYKTAARKQITDQGYDIILNIGDQISDLKGGYADKTFKLPNPYYFIP